jgi:hypothetical protein
MMLAINKSNYFIMRCIYTFITVTICLVYISAYSSAKKLYNKGNYEVNEKALTTEQLTAIRNSDKNKRAPNMNDVVLDMQKELTKKSVDELDFYFSRNYNTPF